MNRFNRFPYGRILNRAIIYLICISIAGCAFVDETYKRFATDSEINELVAKANVAIGQGDWGLAMTAYENAVSIKPHDLELRIKLADAYEHDGRVAQALNNYQFIINDSQASDAQLKTARDRKTKLTPKSVLSKPAAASVEVKREEKFKQYEKPRGLDFVIAPPKDVKDVPTVLPPELIGQQSSNNAQVDTEVHAFLDSWREAWTSRNLKSYFNHYVNTFSGDSKTAVIWREQRKSKLAANQSVNLTITDVHWESIANDQLEVTFIQQYQAGNYKDTGRKLLKLLRVAGRWQIVQESFKTK